MSLAALALFHFAMFGNAHQADESGGLAAIATVVFLEPGS
jgi:hypothetical protein